MISAEISDKGRERLMEEVCRMARRSANRRHVEMIYICDERSSRKSSLTQDARGSLEADFIGAEVDLRGVKTMEEAFYSTWRAFLENNRKQRRVVDFFSKLKMKIRPNRDGVAKAKQEGESRDFSDILQGRNFSRALAALASASGKKGAVVVWRNIGGLAKLEKFAYWLKRFVEINADAPALLIVEDADKERWKIIKNNPSANRVFAVVLDVE